jgi:pimeloyl-ACP methyl ester carboxylesterase
MLSQRTRHIAFAVGSVLMFVVLAGVTYQSVATALERRQFPYPGRLITVGDHQLHIYCTGPDAGPDGGSRGAPRRDTPTVVLEGPAAGISVGWAWVQGDLARTTRVCSYDRAGLGWSEAGEAGYDAARVPDELHALLDRSGERGPFVIAGHELGATFARMYATRFREQTAALVLVDDPAETESAPQSMPRLVSAWPWLARVGVLRATGALSRRADGFPDPPAGAARAFLNRPDHLARGAIEIARREEAIRLAAANHLDPAVPVVRVNTSREALPPVLLDSRDRARDVTRALEETVTRIRP